jgi:predicted ribosomally synthesized peptide with nif11-like leader
MSVESAKAFMERMKIDQEFAKNVNEFKTMEAALSFVASQGYDFTAADLQELPLILTDDDLANVAGGSDNSRRCFFVGPGSLAI